MSSSPTLDPALLPLVDPRHTALLVIDKQNGYIDPTQPFIQFRHTSSDALMAVIPKLDNFIEQVRSLGMPIVWTQMIDNDHASLPNIAHKMKLGNTPAITEQGQKSFEFYGRVTPVEGEKIIVKNRYDAFLGTDLAQYLHAHDIGTLVLTGAYASRCVLSTAVVGNDLGYSVFVVEDLVGVIEAFANELAPALEIMNTILGYVVSSEALLVAWNIPLSPDLPSSSQ